MKKLKLISSLSVLGTVAAATPIIATSCSNQSYYVVCQDPDRTSATTVSLNDMDTPPTSLGHLYALAYDDKGNKVDNADINYNFDLSNKPAWITNITAPKGEINVDTSSYQEVEADTWTTTWRAEYKGYQSPKYSITINFVQYLTGNGGFYIDDSGEYQGVKFPTPITKAHFDNGCFIYNETTKTVKLPIYEDASKNETTIELDPSQIVTLQIQSIDTDVIKIPNSFMERCDELLYVDIKGFTGSNLIEIGNNFLYKCEKLSYVYSASSTSITTIGKRFLAECLNLVEIDLSPLSEVTSFGSNFLERSQSLISIDMAPLSKVTEISESFMWSSGVKKITGLDKLTKVTKIDDDFMGYAKIEEADFTGLGSEIDGDPVVEAKLFYDCDNFVKFNPGDLDFSNAHHYSLTAYSKNSPAYTNGLLIVGGRGEELKRQFGDLDGPYWRKIIY